MAPSWKSGRAAGFVLVLAALAGCRRAPTGVSAVAVAVRAFPSTLTLAAGRERQLSAEVVDALNRPVGAAPLRFTVADRALATVTPEGLVRSLRAVGATAVIVASGSLRAEVPLRITGGAPESVAIVSGDAQEGQAGATLPEPIVVRLLDGLQNAVAGAHVELTTDDGGSVNPAEPVTSNAGVATARWTLGPHAGAQSLRVRVQDASAGARIVARADSGAVATIVALPSSGPAATAGESVALRVKLADAEGNPKRGVTVRWRVTSGRGRLLSLSSTSDETGVAAGELVSASRPGRVRVVAQVAGAARLETELMLATHARDANAGSR